jgi:MFS family permease
MDAGIMIAPLQRQTQNGLRVFLLIWFGQFVSRTGTALTRFALLIWAFEQTGGATALALLGFFAFLPALLVNPLAGVLVDRLDRRICLILADLGAGLVTVALLALYQADALRLWHLYLAQFLAGTCDAIQLPAYAAATTLLLPKRHYGRGAGIALMFACTALLGATMALSGYLFPAIRNVEDEPA